ncbi:phosphonate ABC transporter, permease protein PhnE [Roseococcus sp. DSY-14]|uniref:phosphonate ABC transporter, permease protein PhnE n=1 Tax=Roseococcus sp. DSY-14 TaxID=3369650 RepID=UPI00387B575C
MPALLEPARLGPLLAQVEEARLAARRRALAGGALLLALVLLSAWVAEVRPALLWERGDRFLGYFDRTLTLDTGARAWTDPGEWFWGLDRWLAQLGDTLLMAYVGTVLGALGGFALGLLGAANTGPGAAARFAARRVAEFGRTVPEIVFALVFVIAFGLGPLAGVLAIAIHSAGALGKLFAEVVENIDMKPVEGARAAGASWAQVARFAVVPQVLAGFASYALLRLEVNVRGAAVLGFVGAGGIGQDLVEAVRKFYYADVSAILLLIVLAVTLMDLATSALRRRLLGAA